MNTSLFFQSDFYRQADELSAALVRVEAVWADRFEPSWTIFSPSPSLIWQAIGQSFVDGFAAGVRQATRLRRVTAEIRKAGGHSVGSQATFGLWAGCLPGRTAWHGGKTCRPRRV